MMRIARFVVAPLVMLLVLYGIVTGQPTERAARVGLIVTTPALKEAFLRGLAESGYVDGQNLTVVHRPLGNAAVGDLLRANVEVICATSPPMVKAVKQATSSIPIVAVELESDPVASGLVTSLARPGGNLTGFFLD